MTGNELFESLYVLFLKAKTAESKWRNKIVLDKLLYDEWAAEYFKEEMQKAHNESGQHTKKRKFK